MAARTRTAIRSRARPEKPTPPPRRDDRAPLQLWAVVLGGLVVVAAMGVYLFILRPQGVPERPDVGAHLHSLGLDPTNPDRLFLGGHTGAFASADGGKTWRPLAGLAGADIMAWAIDPTAPGRVYAAGHGGLFFSADGGARWGRLETNLPSPGTHALGMDPRQPQTLFADVVRHGIYRSADGGASWDLQSGDQTLVGPIVVDPRDGRRLYIGEYGRGLRTSADGGRTWEDVGKLPSPLWLSQNPNRPEEFYAANAQGRVLRSADAGKTWAVVEAGLPPYVSAVAYSPVRVGTLFVGALLPDGPRIYRSDDGGQAWREVN